MNFPAAPAWMLLAACGGSAPPPEPPKEPAPRPTRVVVEDETEEPEDGVTFVASRGRMDPARIEAGIAPHTTALSECYTTSVGRRRWLGGQVTIHWEIAKDGTVTAVKLSESTLGAWPIEKCLLEIARTATFEPPKGGDADFSIPLDFSSKGRVTTWDDDMALRAVGGQLAGLDACVAGAARPATKNGKTKKKQQPPVEPPPELPATPPDDVTVTVYVGPQGKAQSVGFSSPKSVLTDAWGDCAAKVALAWRLPDPRGTIAKLAIKYRPE